jgi:Fe-S-cluster-containing dehydrogenase component/DMSO reductase anchor subunit
MTAHGLFVLDLDRCTGCAACVVACSNENQVFEGLSWRRIHTFNRQRLATAPVIHYSMACNHCLDPACLAGCPANAITKDLSTGAVLIEEDVCMGCRYCSWVCPYEAPQFNVATGIMEKCTFCTHRLTEGLDPACVTACPTHALRFETENAPAAVDHPGFPDTGLRPAVRVVGDRRHQAPDMTAAPVAVNVVSPRPAVGWSGFRNEWSLWFFSSIAILLVAWFTAATALATPIALPVFAGAGVLAMAVSALHLGRISRIWRALLNVRRSWVSREVVLFSAFFLAACASLWGQEAPVWARWAIVAVGFGAMYSMDMVYRVRGQPVLTVPHSAMAMLSVALYVGILTGNAVLMVPAATVKLVLYLARRERPVPSGSILAPIRIGVGILPALALGTTGTVPVAVAMFGAVVGELIDRAEFYACLRFLTPTHQIETDLARRHVAVSKGLEDLTA